MDVRLDGRIVLVTGATQGAGEAITEAATRAGAAGLLLTGRDAGRGAEVRERLSRAGTPAEFVQADLADAGAPARLVAGCIARFCAWCRPKPRRVRRPSRSA